MKLRARGSRGIAVVVAIVAFAATLTFDNAAATDVPTPAISTQRFDSTAPFTLVSNDGPGEPHIDTLDGTPPSPEEVAAVDEALDVRIVDPPAHMAYATSGSNYFWRGDGQDLDVHLRTVTSMPDEVVLVIKAVFEDFQASIDMELPDELWHEVNVSWDSDLPDGVLAGASTTWVTVNQGGTNYRIPLALYEILGGSEATFNAPSMSITINANAGWDMTLEPADQAILQYYLKTVLLHEVAHGLGFTSGASTLAAANATPPTPWGNHIHAQQDPALSLNVYGSSILESNDLWFENSDGTWERVFDPTSWQEGSSLSHLNESTYPYRPGTPSTPGALMTPYLQRGETSRVDGVVVGVLSRLGYRTSMTPLAPAIEVTHADATATVTITPTEAGALNVPARQWNVRLVDDNNAVVAQEAVTATSRSVTFTGLQAATSYTAVAYATTDRVSTETSVAFLTDPGPTPTTVVTSTTGPTTAPTTATGPSPTVSTTPPLPPGAATTVPSTRRAEVESPSSACLIEGNSEPFGLSTDERSSVYRLYCSYFLRLPDESGFAYWIDQNTNGTDLRRISDFFADSDEFTDRYGSLTDAAYVRLTYANVLEREPDAGGYIYWVTRLETGLSRGDLTLYFSDSAEFRERTHTERLDPIPR